MCVCFLVLIVRTAYFEEKSVRFTNKELNYLTGIFNKILSPLQIESPLNEKDVGKRSVLCFCHCLFSYLLCLFSFQLPRGLC